MRQPPPGRRPGAGGPRRPRADDTLPGVQFPIVEDLTRIAADDAFLDAIAAGGADLRSVFAGAGGVGSAGPIEVSDIFGGGRRPVGLGPLLMAWRSELLEPPMPALPTLAPRPMLAPADRSRRRSMRSLLSVGIAIGALLMASTAVGARSAQPGQPLWGLSQVLWSDHADSVEARGKVEAAIDVAKNAIKNGDTTAANQALLIADGEVGKVLPVDGLDALRHDLGVLKQQAGSVQNPVDSQPGSEPAIVAAGVLGSFGGGVVPPGGAVTSRARTTASTIPSPVLPIVPSSGTVASPTGAPGPSTGVGGNPPSSVTGLPNAAAVVTTSSASSSPPLVPAPVITVDPLTSAAPGTTEASTPPVDPTTPAPVETSAPSTPAPATTESPTVPPTTDTPTTDPSTTATPTDPPTTDTPTTAEPSTSSSDPSTSSVEPTLASPTEASTTSELPTTVETTPSTDADGSTTGTTTQTAPVNSTDDLGTMTNDTMTDDPNTQQPGQDPGTDANSTAAAR